MVEEKIPTMLQRKIAGLCTRCGKPSDDANLCDACTRRASAYMRDMRQRRRERGQCVDCGRKSRKRRCAQCFKRKGVSKPRRGVEQTNHATTEQHGGFRTVTEVDSRYEAGRTRERYIGRGSRGAPSRAQLEAEDERTLRIAAREMLRAADLLAEANTLPADTPRIQREAARREALSPAIPAARLALAVLRRNGAIDEEAEETEDGE